jgi:hypothetical protein
MRKRWTSNFPLGTRPDKARHDEMVALVERMLDLSEKKYSGKIAPSQLDPMYREVTATDT